MEHACQADPTSKIINFPKVDKLCRLFFKEWLESLIYTYSKSKLNMSRYNQYLLAALFGITLYRSKNL